MALPRQPYFLPEKKSLRRFFDIIYPPEMSIVATGTTYSYMVRPRLAELSDSCTAPKLPLSIDLENFVDTLR